MYLTDKNRVDELEPGPEKTELARLVAPSGIRSGAPDRGEECHDDAESVEGGGCNEEEDTEAEDDEEDEEQQRLGCPKLAHFADKHQDRKDDALLDAAHEMSDEDHLVFDQDLERDLEELEAWVEKNEVEMEISRSTSQRKKMKEIHQLTKEDKRIKHELRGLRPGTDGKLRMRRGPGWWWCWAL